MPCQEFEFLEHSEPYKSLVFRTPFGDELGAYQGVVAYSNGSNHHISEEVSFLHGKFSDYKLKKNFNL